MDIDILHLVDRLEALIEHGRHFPFMSSVLVNEGTCLDIIDQMRISLPEEIKEAKRLEQEREERVAEAHDEAARIISKAREDAARLLADHELRRQAQQQAERILEEAQRQSQAIRQGADDYAAQVLTQLAEEVAALQKTIGNGLASLEERRGKAQGAAPRAARARAGSEQAEAL